MNSCLHEDTLLEIGQALDWEVETPLRHLYNCAECSGTLADLRELHRLLDRPEGVEPALTARIIDALEREMAAEAAATEPRASPTAERWVRPIASATVAFVVLVVAAALQDDGAVAVWPAILLALIAGTVAGVLGEMGRRSRGAAFPSPGAF